MLTWKQYCQANRFEVSEAAWLECHSVIDLAGGNTSSPNGLRWFIIYIDSKNKISDGVSVPCPQDDTETKGARWHEREVMGSQFHAAVKLFDSLKLEGGQGGMGMKVPRHQNQGGRWETAYGCSLTGDRNGLVAAPLTMTWLLMFEKDPRLFHQGVGQLWLSLAFMA